MQTDSTRKYLLKAIDGFRKRITVVSPDYKILATNRPQGSRAAAELVGRYCYDVFHERSSPCNNCAVTAAVDNLEPSLCPQPNSLSHKGRIPCYYAYPIYAEDGRIEAFVSMDFELPAFNMLEEQIRRSNMLLQNLLLSAVDCVVAADMSGNIFLFNDSAVDVFGYSIHEALNEINVRDIYPDGKAYSIMADLRSERYGGMGKLQTYHTDILAKNGERIPISLYASIIYEDGREIATIGFFHDLRERLRIRRELENTQVQLLQAEKMASLGKLAAGVAHQINNPLGGITLFAKLILEEYELEEGIQEDLNRILRDAQRCRHIVKELLEFTRKTRHLMQPNDINESLRRTLFLLENQALFQNIDIQEDLQGTLPPVTCDAQQMNHLFMNIILNAAQAMEGNGTLYLKTAFWPHRQRVSIDIADTGSGIPQDVLPRVFEPFYTTKEEGKGTGLGLSLAYNIVESHGGRISVDSEPGKGALFHIELPLSQKNNKESDRG